jgi:hypothetical protein
MPLQYAANPEDWAPTQRSNLMLKKIILGVILAAGLATMSVASILLDASEQQVIELSASIDILGLMSRSGNLPDQTPADLI